MFKQIQKAFAGALCALALTVAAAAPASAHELAYGRAGAIQNFQFKGNEALARLVANECVGLIHQIRMDHEADKIYWTVLSRDGKQTVVIVEADIDDSNAIVAGGVIPKGTFRGTQINVRGHLQDDLFLIDVKMSFGGSEVAFTQALEPLPDPE